MDRRLNGCDKFNQNSACTPRLCVSAVPLCVQSPGTRRRRLLAVFTGVDGDEAVNDQGKLETFDRANPEKQATAISILEGGDRLVVSTQVLLEAWWVLTRRLAEPLTEDQASSVIDNLTELPVVNADPELIRRAIRTSRQSGIVIWDAMIIEAARSAGCRRVLSEDLQDGRDFSGVAIGNPFAQGP